MKFFLFLFGCLMKILGFGTVNIKSERTRHRIWLGSDLILCIRWWLFFFWSLWKQNNSHWLFFFFEIRKSIWNDSFITIWRKYL